MAELPTSKRKKRFMMMMANDEEIFKLLDNPDAEYPDDLIGVNIFPQIKVDFTEQETRSYIGVKLDYPSICKNELYKNYVLTVMVISNNRHLKDPKTGYSRVDMIAERVTNLLNWNNEVGFTIELVSDIEDPLNEKFYYRRLVFKSLISNSLEDGVKKYQ